MKRFSTPFVTLLVVAHFVGCAAGDNAVPPNEPERFASPAMAVEALNLAARAEDKQAMLKVLGTEGAPFVNTGNPAKDRRAIERFSRRMIERHSLEAKPNGDYVLYVGKGDAPLPLTIIRDGNNWSFAGNEVP